MATVSTEMRTRAAYSTRNAGQTDQSGRGDAMRKDDIDVVHLQAFKTLLRPFDDAVQVGGDPVSHRKQSRDWAH